MKWLLAAIFLFYSANCLLIRDGKCPDMPALSNFNKERVLGKWYLIKAYENEFTRTIDCKEDELISWNGNTLAGTAHYLNKNTSAHEELHFTKVLRGDADHGKFTTRYTLNGVDKSKDSQIIDTDYDNYIITWACEEHHGKSEQSLWISSRKKTLSDNIMEKITGIMKQHNLDTSILKEFHYDHCK